VRSLVLVPQIADPDPLNNKLVPLQLTSLSKALRVSRGEGRGLQEGGLVSRENTHYSAAV
jgi:hypothetical protein